MSFDLWEDANPGIPKVKDIKKDTHVGVKRECCFYGGFVA